MPKRIRKKMISKVPITIGGESDPNATLGGIEIIIGFEDKTVYR